jgi:dihydroorotase-like cyclic amidohydrolase
MEKFDTVLVNGKAVIPRQGIVECSIGVKNEKIAALLTPEDRDFDADEVIDAAGRFILPGAIDPHVHLEYMASFEELCSQDTRAAAIGGVTMMKVYIQIGDSERFEYLRDKGNELSLVDFTFSPTIRSADAATIIDDAVREWGISSFKFFMAYRAKEGASLVPGSPPNNLNDGLMYEIFEQLAGYRSDGHAVVACVHAENFEVTDWFMEKQMEGAEDSLRAWHEASPGFAEAENAMRASYFAELVGCPAYIVHLGAKESVEAIRRAKRTHPRVYAETCPHYLARTCDDPIGNFGKISPPIRTKEDQEVVWEALADGTFDTVGSDNTGTKKEKKQGTVWEAARGIPGVGTLLPVVLSEGVNKGRISLERAVEVTSYNAARIFDMYPKKGTIQIGSDADLVVVDLDLEQEATPELLQHYSDYNIYEGLKLKGWPVLTMVRGNIVARDFQVVSPQRSGRFQNLTAWARSLVPASRVV